MTEFLTENVQRAYPLEREWLSHGADGWQQTLVDAFVGTDYMLKDGVRVKLISVTKTSTALVYKIGTGISGDDGIDVTVSSGLGVFANVTGKNAHYCVVLVVNGPAVDECLSKSASSVSVNVPFALRCVSGANYRVESIAAYSTDSCETKVFGSSETAVKTITGGDVVFGSKDGIDIVATEMAPLEGRILRLTAITAPKDTTESDKGLDIMIRGDDCFTVEAIPGAYVESGVIKKCTEAVPAKKETDCGVIIIGTKCKPCCQCEDYKEAADALRPYEAKAVSVQGILDEAKGIYNAARTLFTEVKDKVRTTVNSYDNVRTSATAVTSGGVYSGSNAKGKRNRIAVTLAVANLTLEDATVTPKDGIFYVPGMDLVSVNWRTTGSNPRSGTNLDTTWTLASGDGLSVVATYAKAATKNEFSRPDGMTATVTLKLASAAASEDRTEDVK